MSKTSHIIGEPQLTALKAIAAFRKQLATCILLLRKMSCSFLPTLIKRQPWKETSPTQVLKSCCTSVEKSGSWAASTAVVGQTLGQLKKTEQECEKGSFFIRKNHTICFVVVFLMHRSSHPWVVFTGLKFFGSGRAMGCGGSVSKQHLNDELEAHQLELENERRRLQEKDTQLQSVQECLQKQLRGSEQELENNGWRWWV